MTFIGNSRLHAKSAEIWTAGFGMLITTQPKKKKGDDFIGRKKNLKDNVRLPLDHRNNPSSIFRVPNRPIPPPKSGEKVSGRERALTARSLPRSINRINHLVLYGM